MTNVPDPTASDRDLLRAWSDHRDQECFQALCLRHAGLVVAACRRLLAPDPDDATQAVFIILARKPRAVADPDRLAGWLLGVARRVVSHQLRTARRRQRHERSAAMDAERQPDSPVDDAWSDARLVLDDALARLSPARREAIARFYLQGKTQATVADELGCSVDAVKTRVHEGLEQLRALFARRGVALGIAAIASGLASEAAAMDPDRAQAVSQAAVSTGGAATALAEEVLHPMFLNTLLVASCVGLITGVVAVSATLFTMRPGQPPAAGVGMKPQDLRADELAKALGMLSFLVRIPTGPEPRRIAFTYANKDGTLYDGMSMECQPGGEVRVIYWIEDDAVQYIMISPKGSMTASIPAKDIISKYYSSSCIHFGESATVFNLGDTVAVWSAASPLAGNDAGAGTPDHIRFTVVDKTQASIKPPNDAAGTTPKPAGVDPF